MVLYIQRNITTVLRNHIARGTSETTEPESTVHYIWEAPGGRKRKGTKNMMSFDETLADQDHAVSGMDDVTVHERLIAVEARLEKIEKSVSEFKELAGKIWGFVEQMKDNPMFAAMLGGLPRK
jgi:hypothetical protein